MLDVPDQRTKSGISHRYLRPHQGIVDPELLRGVPAEVTSSCGLDVVCHAVESFVSKPYDSRERPESPDDRPPYQGANPVSDVWSAKALEYGGRYLRRAVEDADDLEARGAMMLAASLAGIGFGSAGVHIPHACAYPIASLKHEYQPPGYPDDHPFVPHGWSVIVTAPAAFRYTYEADPDKHRRAAELIAGQELPDADENTLPRGADRADARRRRAERRARARLRRRRRRRRWSRAPSSSSGCSSCRRASPPRTTSPRSSATLWRTGRRARGRITSERTLNTHGVHRRGRITSDRTMNTASSRSKRATGRSMPAKRPSPR